MKKILLIGDSIRQGYSHYVRLAFEGVAEIYEPQENCRFTTYILRSLLDWKNELKCGDDVDLIHWNAGLWDDLILPDGKPLITLDQYKENVERISDMLEVLFPKANVIFATSTPVREEMFKTYKRYNRDTETYNEAACEIVRKHGGSINDLYTLLKGVPDTYHSDMTHFYTKDATKIISNQIIAHIEKALDIKSKTLDYNELFHCSIEPTVGM